MGWIEELNRLVWGAPMILLLLGTGVYLSIRCGWPQLTPPRVLYRELRREKGPLPPGAVPPFRALCTALAACVGTGNIAGVAGAIALGGPGAVFWMWLSAVPGMCTKYAEVTLAVHYRKRTADGSFRGGPMDTMRAGLPRSGRALACCFSLCGALAAFGIGNLTQVQTICTAVGEMLTALAQPDDRLLRTAVQVTAILCGLAAALVLLGGSARLGRVCGLLVPFMAGLYLAGCASVLIVRADRLPSAFLSILQGAFSPRAATGGLCAAGFRSALRQGVSRGVFSNEAGLGSSPIAHASASVQQPARQGLFGIIEVFFDTVVLCTVTALVILTGLPSEAIPYGSPAGAELTLQALCTVLPAKLASVGLALCLSLFALSSVLAWGFYGSRCAEDLFGRRGAEIYLPLFCLTAAAAGFLPGGAVWSLAGALNGLMALPNLISLIMLAPVCAGLNRFREK